MDRFVKTGTDHLSLLRGFHLLLFKIPLFTHTIYTNIKIFVYRFVENGTGFFSSTHN